MNPATTKTNKKISFAIIATLSIILGSFSFAYCLPEGESVIEGNASFDRSEANVLKINTGSDKLIVEYGSFNLLSGESIYFSQPAVNSQALNRVVGPNISNISGSIYANGIIYIVNPNGINIGSSAKIDVGGLVVSTLNISNADFLNGKYNFFKDGQSAFLINQGNIVVTNGGYVCLLSQALENKGVIQA